MQLRRSSNIVLLVLRQEAEALFQRLGLLHVKLRICLCLLLEHKRQVQVLINVALNISKLLGWILGIALVDDFVIVSPLLQFSKIEPFIDIIWILLHELRQALFEMWVEWAWIYEQLASQDVLSESVFWNHASDRVLENKFRSFLEHVL